MSKEKDPTRFPREVARWFGGLRVSLPERRKGNKRFMHHRWLCMDYWLHEKAWKVLHDKLCKVQRLAGEEHWLSILVLGKLGLAKDKFLVVMTSKDFKDLHLSNENWLDREEVEEKKVEWEERVQRENSADEFLSWSLGRHAINYDELDEDVPE